MTRARWSVGACALLLLLAGCGDDTPEEAPSEASLPLLSTSQLDQALLTARTVGAAYARQGDQLASASSSLGCLDALEPTLLAAEVSGPTAQARVEFDTAATLPSSSVRSIVVTVGTEAAATQALDDFSTAAGACTAVDESDAGADTALTVTSRVVPVKAPVNREVLVVARGSIGNGVTAPVIGRMVKVGRIGRQLVAVETTGVGAYAPDITPYYNAARARLIKVVAGQDPGAGRLVG